MLDCALFQQAFLTNSTRNLSRSTSIFPPRTFLGRRLVTDEDCQNTLCSVLTVLSSH